MGKIDFDTHVRFPGMTEAKRLGDFTLGEIIASLDHLCQLEQQADEHLDFLERVTRDGATEDDLQRWRESLRRDGFDVASGASEDDLLALEKVRALTVSDVGLSASELEALAAWFAEQAGLEPFRNEADQPG